jgi:hypothetical protein
VIAGAFLWAARAVPEIVENKSHDLSKRDIKPLQMAVFAQF